MEQLLNIFQNTKSNDIVKNICKTMTGTTFHHHYHILYDIRTLLGETNKIYTEIGTYCGGSTSLLLHHNYNTEINCIDPLHVLPEQKNILNENIKKYNINNYKVNIYEKFSTDINFLNSLTLQNFKTDILFIDGDHSYNGVISDFNNFEQFVNPKGYIIFDDYLDYKWSPDVKKAVDYIVSNLDENKFEIIGSLENIHNSFDNNLNLKNLNEFIIKKF